MFFEKCFSKVNSFLSVLIDYTFHIQFLFFFFPRQDIDFSGVSIEVEKIYYCLKASRSSQFWPDTQLQHSECIGDKPAKAVWDVVFWKVRVRQLVNTLPPIGFAV